MSIKLSTQNIKEALAVIGVGLFSFGLWQIYPPSACLFLGAVGMTPLTVSLRTAK